MTDYILVGAPIGDSHREMKWNGDNIEISDITGVDPVGPVVVPGDASLRAVLDDQQLNVETIGRLVVEMSSSATLSDEALATRAAIIKGSLIALDLNGATLLPISDALKIEQSVSVVFNLDTRASEAGSVDINTRNIMIPYGGLIQKKLDQVTPGAIGTTEFPPLTYELDRNIQLVHMRSLIELMIEDAGAEHGIDVTKILKSVNSSIDQRIQGTSSQNEILKDAKRAFYRSVGIYSTNMCR